MKLSRRQLKEIINNTLGLISEGMSRQQLDKLIIRAADNLYWTEEAAAKVTAAYESGIQKKPQIEWLINFYIQFPRNNEPIEDIIGTMKDFNRFNPAIKNLGLEHDMTRYESPSDLRSSVMRSQGKVSKADLTKESTHLGKFGAYDLYLPHTREASCTLGAGTSWCTAIPGKGNNLFYNYVAKLQAAQQYGGDVYLFYLIIDESVKEKTPLEYRKLSLGYVNGEIRWPKDKSEAGGLTVTGQNNGFTEEDARMVLGSSIMDVENAIEEYVNKRSSAGKTHPAKDKFKELARNPALLKRELQGSSSEVKEDTLDMVRSIYKAAAQENTRGTQREGDSRYEIPIYPPGIKEILFKEAQKMFYKKTAQMAKRAYDYHDTYSVTLSEFMQMVEHPDGDMYEPRHSSIEIFDDIRTLEFGVSKSELMMNTEYFDIIRRAGLELTNAKTGEVVQPEDVTEPVTVSSWEVNIDRVK